MNTLTLQSQSASVPELESTLRASRRAVAVALWTALAIPAQVVLIALGRKRAATRFGSFYHRGLARTLGLRVEIAGAPRARHALFIANHSSYLDIPVFAGAVPAAFVARHDIAGWPGIGLLAALGRTVYAERRVARSGAVRDAMRARLAAGESLVMFPEGTTNNGVRILPFRSSLFSAVDLEGPLREGLRVQPAVITYHRVGGMPIPGWMRPVYAWYGDMPLVSHLWRVLKLAPVNVRVTLLPAVDPAQFADRKALARHCEGMIASAYAAIRRQAPEPREGGIRALPLPAGQP